MRGTLHYVVFEQSPTPPPRALLRSQCTVRQGPDSLLLYLATGGDGLKTYLISGSRFRERVIKIG